VLRSIIDLQAAINRNLEQHNDDPKPFIWTKPAYPILAKLDRLPVPLRGSLLTLRWRELDSNRRSLSSSTRLGHVLLRQRPAVSRGV
jgi:hypothetical protein